MMTSCAATAYPSRRAGADRELPLPDQLVNYKTDLNLDRNLVKMFLLALAVLRGHSGHRHGLRAARRTTQPSTARGEPFGARTLGQVWRVVFDDRLHRTGAPVPDGRDVGADLEGAGGVGVLVGLWDRL